MDGTGHVQPPSKALVHHPMDSQATINRWLSAVSLVRAFSTPWKPGKELTRNWWKLGKEAPKNWVRIVFRSFVTETSVINGQSPWKWAQKIAPKGNGSSSNQPLSLKVNSWFVDPTHWRIESLKFLEKWPDSESTVIRSKKQGGSPKTRWHKDKGILPNNPKYSQLCDASVTGLNERPHEDPNLAALGVKQYQYTMTKTGRQAWT